VLSLVLSALRIYRSDILRPVPEASGEITVGSAPGPPTSVAPIAGRPD